MINGEPAYIDISMLPLGMIEGIDVSPNGSMPEFGARASGRVINIRIDEDYEGNEIGGRLRVPFAGGGGEERRGKFSTAVSRGKFRAFVSVEHRSDSALLASGRPFSREQDHTARGGRDLRLPWGYPAVVEARSGAFAGFADEEGNPVSALLVPEGQDGFALDAGDFLPGDPGLGSGAADQRRFNSSDYRMLVSPSERTGGSVGLNHAFGPRLNLGFEASYSETNDTDPGAPPVSSASDETLVPAAYNPFGQDVEVGLVHVEFGPTRELSRSRRTEGGIKAGGRLGESWKWSGGFGYRHDASREAARDLDRERFTDALAASDPAARFNPFGDARAGPVNAHLYPGLTIERARDQTTEQTRFDARHEIAPGVPFLDEGGSRYNPADWRVRGHFSWANGGWNASLRVSHTSARPATATGGEIAGYTDVDVNAGYRFREPIWGTFGEGLRVSLGIGNVFDEAPPFVDVLHTAAVRVERLASSQQRVENGEARAALNGQKNLFILSTRWSLLPVVPSSIHRRR
ncbi:MAG: hypothetical protein ACREIA_02910 [Opitutaceae bacterium]